MTTCTPPRAFSIRSSDPSYCPQWKWVGKTFDVLLDGVSVSRVVAYDCDAGWVRRLQTKEDGTLNLSPDLDAVPEEELHGVVTVAWYG